MDNEFMANIQREGERIDSNPEEEAKEPVESEREETDTPPDSPTEKEPSEEPESPTEESVEASETDEEEPAVYHAFHKHPRWIAREQEMDELKKQNSELLEFKQNVEPLLSKVKAEEEGIPPEFTALYGNNPEAWRVYQSLTEKQQDNFLKKVREEFKPLLEVAEQTKKQTESEKWAENQWKEFESNNDVQKELKSMGKKLDDAIQAEIISVLKEYRPTDDQGNLSILKGFEIWKKTKPAPTPKKSVEEKKNVGDIDSKPSNESEEKGFSTHKDFIGKNFADFK